jgi:hypothetical protein
MQSEAIILKELGLGDKLQIKSSIKIWKGYPITHPCSIPAILTPRQNAKRIALGWGGEGG